MYKGFIRYLLIVVLLFGFWNLVHGFFPFLLLMLMLIMFIVTTLLSLPSMKKTEVIVHVDKDKIRKNDKISFQLERQDSSFIHCGKVWVDYEIVDCHQQTIIHNQLWMEDLTKDVKTKIRHCGYYQIIVKKYICYDIFQCFFKVKKQSSLASFYVFPTYTDISYQLLESKGKDSNNEEYSPYQSGDDYTEIFELRKYRDNDNLHHIHWKASLKRNELLVKEGSQPIIQSYLLLIELTENVFENDKIYEYYYSLGRNLIESHVSFEMIDLRKDYQIFKRKINEYHELDEYICSLMMNPIVDKRMIFNDLKDQSLYVINSQGIEVYDL